MLYLEPSLMLDCLDGASLPFVRDAVVTDRDAFCATLLSALGPLEQELDDLFVDDFLMLLMQSLARHAGQPAKPMAKTGVAGGQLARDYLTEDAIALSVRSGRAGGHYRA